MNRIEFLNRLRKSLSGFDSGETERVISYYTELIDDKIDSGADEYRIIAELGDVDKIAMRIKAGFTQEMFEDKKPDGKKVGVWSGFRLVLKLFATPILFPLGIVFFVLFVAIAAVNYSLVIAAASISVSFAVALVPAIVLGAGYGPAVALISGGICLAAIGISGILALFLAKFGTLALKYMLKGASRMVKKIYS
jgi:Predicted membrane protein